MKNYLKFGLLIVAVLGTLAWLAVGGISETKTYYKTVAELKQLGDQAQEKRLRVGGDIAPNSIVREGANVSFTLAQDKLRMQVVYSGIDPLPDTFRDGALAVVNLGEDADTTGAVYGQIAGAYYGADGIPAEWRAKIAMRELIEQRATELHTMAFGSPR